MQTSTSIAVAAILLFLLAFRKSLSALTHPVHTVDGVITSVEFVYWDAETHEYRCGVQYEAAGRTYASFVARREKASVGDRVRVTFAKARPLDVVEGDGEAFVGWHAAVTLGGVLLILIFVFGDR